MFSNNMYNLMEQAVEESQSLWRIKNHYIKDAKDCEECKEFWEKLEKDKEKHCKDLQELIASHIIDKKKHYYYEKGEKKVEAE
jgi:transcriptional regulator of NAD metabolism